MRGGVYEVVFRVRRRVFDAFGVVCTQVHLVVHAVRSARNAPVTVTHNFFSTIVAPNTTAGTKALRKLKFRPRQQGHTF